MEGLCRPARESPGIARVIRAFPLTCVLALACAVTLLGPPSAAARWNGAAAREGEPGEPLYTIRPPNLFHHNVGLLELMVTNVGVVGNPFVRDVYGAGWHGGDYLFAAALWIGAVTSDNLAHVSTGIAYTEDRTELELLPPLDPRYTIYEGFEGMTGGDRRGFSASRGDDDGDGEIDEDFPNGIDDDRDGRIDEDYEAISQQMFSCEYWDNLPEARAGSPDHRPLNLHIRQRSFSWSTESADNFVGLDYVIVNEGWETLQQLYLGYFVDSDAGLKHASDYFTDDGGGLVRLDTVYVDKSVAFQCTNRITHEQRDCREHALHVDIAYMRDTPGNETGGSSADDPPLQFRGYFGGMFLGHTTDPFGLRAPDQVGIQTLAFFSGAGTYPNGDPSNDYQRYDLLQRGTVPTRPTTQPADYRYCFSAGPFSELMPGEQLTFQVAFVIGNGLEGMVENSLTAQRIYDGQWRDVDLNPWTGCYQRETCLHIEPGDDPLWWHDPIDSLAPPVGPIKNTECDESARWVDADGDCCTPTQDNIYWCSGKETVVRWVGTVAPPPPHVNVETPEVRRADPAIEGDRKIRIEWDNASELVPDPITGRIIWAGYRLWRVEGWRRPVGSIGPSPDDWQHVATFKKRPTGSELDLDDYTDFSVEPIDTICLPRIGCRSVYPIGHYFYEDTDGLKNGMLYFYDVTAIGLVESGAEDVELSGQAASTEADGVVPKWAAVKSGWKDQIMVVPNPWNGRTAWDLTPSDADPTGTKIAFARLPDRDCQVRIYTLSGDLVETLASGGQGTVFWNMISRNGQDVASGVYLYAVTCGDESKVGRFTIIR